MLSVVHYTPVAFEDIPIVFVGPDDLIRYLKGASSSANQEKLRRGKERADKMKLNGII